MRRPGLASVLVADPPWAFDDALGARGATAHYSCMSVSQICELLEPHLCVAPDAVLFLWRVGAMQQEALDVMRYWGFRPKAELVWRKTTATGKRHFGMGRIVRAEHETCLIGTRGSIAPRSRSIRSTFDAPVGRHSEKPDAFYAIVEALYPGPYFEMFARRRRAGWRQHGNELPTGDRLNGAKERKTENDRAAAAGQAGVS